MLLDFVQLAPHEPSPLYHQLAAALRRAVQEGIVPPGSRLPSIRRAAAELNISRTTVETAYQRLCLEGYVESRPQRGYFARRPLGEERQACRDDAVSHNGMAGYIGAVSHSGTGGPTGITPRYDFTSGRVDASAIDLHIWQKLVRAALTCQDELTSYGDPQGEYGLRKALAAYAFGARGVRAAAEQIVIGAGIQPLLTLLISLLRQGRQQAAPLSVAVEAPGFTQGERIFADFELLTRRLPEQEAPWREELFKPDSDLYLYLPARRPAQSLSMEATRRKLLLDWLSARPGRCIIEDDYNGELRYQSRPLPALQGISSEGVIYLGSFSKLLLPSIRIAYMVLPPSLLPIYRQKAPAYNQTAGKIEQMALQNYIEQGLLEKHLRRLRKLYLKKSQMLRRALEEALPGRLELVLWETDLSYLLTLDCPLSAGEVASRAGERGVAVRPAGVSPTGRPRLLLNFAGIAAEDIIPAAAALAAAL